MKKFAIIILLFMMPGVYFSCKNKNIDTDKTILAEKIQYPVFIKSPYIEETEWWRENMEGSKREKFVNLLLDAAFNGKVKVYDYLDNHPMSDEELKQISSKSDTLTMMRSSPPYDEFDTVVTQQLDRRNIHRITFLEEWYFDEDHFSMEKKVVGIAPALTVYLDSNEVKGYQPLFWIYLDKKYPEKNK